MNICSRHRQIYILIFIVVFASCAKRNSQKEKVQTFPLSDVTLLEGPFKHASDLHIKVLLNYDPDRFLSRFRSNSGLKPKAESYGGWEGGTLAGHSLGHYLSAIILMYQTTDDERFLQRANYIVNELDTCQQVSGSGYLGAYEQAKDIFEQEVAKGNIRSQGFDLNGLWAPFYVQHKIMSGLRDAYRITGNQQALAVERKFADWTADVLDSLSHQQLQEMLHCEFGGMNEVLVDLYTDTKEKKYLALADKFYHDAVLNPLVNQQDSLNGLHANTQIPKVIGLAKRYDATGDQVDFKAATFFWDRVVNHHSYVTGGNANHEYFGQPDQLSRRLSHETTETCNVYNMLKLSDLIFQWNPDPKVADYYERALFNQILSSQHPETGQVIYNLSLEMGGHKHYQRPTSFTCCVGTGMENHAKYGAHIYYHGEDELYINQFIASELNWKAKNFKLRQSTTYPVEQQSKLTVALASPLKLALNIRYPAWAEQGMMVKVNGEEVAHQEQPGSYLTINRTWEDGDEVTIEFPFSLRLEAMPDDHKRIAILYGPLVLAGDLGAVEDPKASDADFVPLLFTEDRAPNSWLKPSQAVNTFDMIGVGKPRNVSLKPFYATHDRRYTVYFDMFNQQEWAEQQAAYEAEREEKKALESVTYDFFQLGEMQPEREHNFQGDSVRVVQMQDRKGRQSERGGWFSFDMKVLPDQPMALVFEYWGGYTGNKTFDILIDGEKIATQNISGLKDGAFVTVEYDFRQQLTTGKDKVQVKIAPHKGSRGGPLFVARTTRK